jgi:magnesium-transporting ATPase (P-type)
MARPQSGALGAARILLRLMRAFNLLTGVMVVVAFPASFLFEPQFFEFFSKQPPRIDPAWLMPVLRTWLVLALAMVAAVHVLLARLLAMVETVRSGDPFVPDNAARLQTIAWCALALQVLHLTFGVMAATLNAAGSNVDWKFSGLTGWLAVVLLFVLARVFEEGTQMREDLERMI